jgi:DNA-binding transcriptional MerR regulator
MLTVSKLAAEVGVNADTIRYDERAGLLPPPSRNQSGYQVYGDGAAERVRLSKGVQRFGVHLREVRELVQVLDRGACPCGRAQALVVKRIAEVDKEIAELARVRDRLATLRRTVRESARLGNGTMAVRAGVHHHRERHREGVTDLGTGAPALLSRLPT